MNKILNDNSIEIDNRLMITDFDVVDNIDNQQNINNAYKGDDDEEMADKLGY